MLASQRDYTTAVYKYMLTLGVTEKGNFICVNQDQHSSYESFNTEVLMRAQWLTSLKNQQLDGYEVLMLPDSTKEPARRMKLPSTMKGNRGRARTKPLLPRAKPLEPKPAEESEGQLDISLLDTQDGEIKVED